MRNLWTRALWGGVTGIAAMDIILGIGRRAGLVKLNLLGGLAGLVSARGVAYSASGGILGFVIHMLTGVLWAQGIRHSGKEFSLKAQPGTRDN